MIFPLPAAERSAISFLETEFDTTTKVSRLTGLYLVAKAPGKQSPRFETHWRSWDAIYGIVLNSICVAFEASILTFILYNELSEGVFSVAVFNILIVAMYIKGTAGITMYVLFGKKFVSILNEMVTLEKCIRYQPANDPHCWFSARTLWEVSRWTTITACVVTRYAMYQEFSDTHDEATAAVVTSIWSVASVFVVYVASAVAHTLARLIYRVLSEYTRHLSALALLAVQHGTAADPPNNGYTMLQDVRLKYLKLGHIAGKLNEILQFSALLSVTSSVVILCTSAYIVTHPGESFIRLLFAACYCVYIVIEMLELVLSSTNLKDQCTKLRDMLDAIPTSRLSDDVNAQILLFKAALDSDKLCTNAFGFFTLDKSLLVSTAASVLSFTILLVQTGQEFKAG